jgi:hypothetical protein
MPAVLPLISASFPSNERSMMLSLGEDEDSRQSNDREMRAAFR